MRIPRFSISICWLFLVSGLMTVGVTAFAQEDISEADQAIRIQKIIELDTARLEELKSDLVRREAAFREMTGYLAGKDTKLLHFQEKLDEVFAVKREMLRRIKNKFDELGIRIPVPGGVIMQTEN